MVQSTPIPRLHPPAFAAREHHNDEPETAPSPQAPGISARARAGALHGRPRTRVLIADDTQDSRELYGFYLTHAGYTVELAADGLSVVSAALAFRPDVIV